MGVSRYVYENGVEWIADRDPAEKDFYFFFGSKMGTEKQRRNERELLHLLEHMFFRGKNMADTLRIVSEMENYGILSNGVTTHNYSYGNFYGPGRNPEQRARICAMGHRALVNNDFDHDEICLEKKIVGVELRQRLYQEIWEQLSCHIEEELYQGTRYGATRQESIDTLPHLKLSDLRSMKKRLFRPNDLVIVTVGRAKDSEIEKFLVPFSELKRERPLEPYKFKLPERKSFRKDFTHRGINDLCFVQHALRDSVPGPDLDLERFATLHVIDQVLAGGDTSVLYKNMRLLHGLTYSPKEVMSLQRPEILLLVNYASLPEDLETNVSVVQENIEKLTTDLLPLSDHNRFCLLAAEDYRRQMNDPNMRGQTYIEYATLDLPFINPRHFETLIRNVTRSDIRALMRSMLEGIGTIVYHPSNVPVVVPYSPTGVLVDSSQSL